MDISILQELMDNASDVRTKAQILRMASELDLTKSSVSILIKEVTRLNNKILGLQRALKESEDLVSFLDEDRWY